ncbi:serine/threonine-protein phosphatase 6 regulatory ankyrin repeat subunit B-like [Paramacrobiotus metropolitanus]|uniref:serine/threonine-protein phosphatase 6 regulatory ankyrin repeat subunit B-like n=1 Tax=Paramacrobiotus metropolitanus TaxID=2943436 RepID=UPI0024465221|nr:serine/threonine-protein phosphatase 6 regulatory ankyrin repeat subunit B-like [Paramacrobiotus metropolitanus]
MDLTVERSSPVLTPRSRGLLTNVISRFKEQRRGYPLDKYAPTMLRIESFTGTEVVNNEEVCATEHSPKRLFKLAVTDNVEQLEQIFNKQRNLVYIKNEAGKSLLHVAAEHGKPLVIDLLVQKGIPVDVKDGEGETSLHMAAMNNNMKVVETLIALNADLYAKNAMLETPLHEAVRFDALDALEALLRTSTRDINIPGWHGRTPLHIAAVQDYLECFKLLVAYGAKINFGCFSKLTAIHAASASDLTHRFNGTIYRFGTTYWCLRGYVSAYTPFTFTRFLRLRIFACGVRAGIPDSAAVVHISKRPGLLLETRSCHRRKHFDDTASEIRILSFANYKYAFG